ncbi:Neurotransmitter-gated ion-channel ligand binding domain protein [Ancylostoma ceylanicum]|uniref:Neurotransmitter-gated ion-channel ligand binding domain protein n=1 Tax=Ancylostoma ceylanicum TaxID=53326 RepID=A0A0D6MBT7_9BILA|nr:Neurotransmitter-gated ion-channel ligand binding domain protein [Ancylostoma ceylanicum]
MVRITDNRGAEKYHLPLEVLQNYTEVDIDFENVCRLHPRTLRIASRAAAKKFHLNTDVLCTLGEAADLIHLSQNQSVIEGEVEEEQTSQDADEVPIKVIYLNDSQTNAEKRLGLDDRLFDIHESIAIFMDKVCDGLGSGDEPEELQYYTEKYGTLAFDITPLGATIEELMEPLKNPDHLDSILRRFDGNDPSSRRPFPSTHLVPFLKLMKYDSRTPPVLFVGDRVTVKIGLQIQAMSNFQLSTMDYAVDTWLRMAWYDPRLRHGSSRPVLVNEFTFLKKIWRPDPMFRNAKAARFHKVSYLNFYMFIFPGGEVFMDIRVYLKPTAAKIVLCKYPHDKPACSLKISSLGFTSDSVEFEWFSDIENAIQLNRDLEIPELSLIKVKAEKCDGTRKSGRIFVSLTVFLTLSAESNSAKEELPKVSYIKAIDIWFGFTSIFVFVTMLQALLVISLEHYSRSLRRKCENNVDEYSNYKLVYMMLRSRRFHRLARNCDTFCKVMYPVTFVLFLIIYGFVIIQGEENKCVSQ